MLGFIVFLLVHVSRRAPLSYEAWKAWLTQRSVSVALLLFFLALLLHTWVGVRDVILDYVHPLAARFSLLALLAVSQIAIGAWVLAIIFGFR